MCVISLIKSMAADLSSSDSTKTVPPVTISVASPPAPAEISQDNVSVGVTKSPWIKPVNGVVEAAAPVMGDSWPTITESTRYPVIKSSSDSLKPADASVSVSKVEIPNSFDYLLC